MSVPIWPVVTENLAEQLSAAQGGIVHPAQLLPYLPLSLQLIEKTLNALTESNRVEKQQINGLTAYVFKESLNKTPHKFAPRQCVYSNEALEAHEYSVISPEVRNKIEAELSLIAANDIWPAEAVWEHELIYLAQNLNAPTSTSEIAGHARLPFKKVEARLNELQARGALHFNAALSAWEEPPMRYPKPAYLRNDSYIRQFPGAMKEEFEVRLVKALSSALIVLVLCFVLAITARFPFPIVLFGGGLIAAFTFLKIFRAPPKPIPEL
jgi:hypothetical protein